MPERIDGLDSLRALLAVCVVLLHASMPYMLSPFPGLAWPVHDASPSGWVDALGWWADSFVMPTFLLMSGFFAAQLLQRKGATAFLENRFHRVLRPLALGMVVLLPMELYLWLLAWVGQGAIEAVKLRSLKVESPHGDHLWGLSHLWFLEYLFLYSLCAWCVVRVVQRGSRSAPSPLQSTVQRSSEVDRRGNGRGEGLSLHVHCRDQTSPRTIDVLPLAVPIAGGLVAGVVLYWHPRVLIGFSHGWLPHPANFIYFGLIFAAGWWLARRHRQGGTVTAGCDLLAVPGTVLFACSLSGLREFAELQNADARVTWSTAVLFGLSGWLSAVGWWGVFLKHFNQRPPRFVCYIAESSFWLYLIHHPLVALMHINLSLVDWPSGMKFVTASIATIALSLVMYECLVRRTRLGALLNGRRPIATPPIVIEEPAADAVRQAA